MTSANNYPKSVESTIDAEATQRLSGEAALRGSEANPHEPLSLGEASDLITKNLKEAGVSCGVRGTNEIIPTLDNDGLLSDEVKNSFNSAVDAIRNQLSGLQGWDGSAEKKPLNRVMGPQLYAETFGGTFHEGVFIAGDPESDKALELVETALGITSEQIADTPVKDYGVFSYDKNALMKHIESTGDSAGFEDQVTSLTEQIIPTSFGFSVSRSVYHDERGPQSTDHDRVHLMLVPSVKMAEGNNGEMAA